MCIFISMYLCIFFLFFFFLVFFTVRTIDVQAVEGNRISLPCPLIPPTRDKVYMVLWFRDDAGIPLYRFVYFWNLFFLGTPEADDFSLDVANAFKLHSQLIGINSKFSHFYRVQKLQSAKLCIMLTVQHFHSFRLMQTQQNANFCDSWF